VIVTKILPDGNGILYTTIVGGSSDDAGNAIAADPATHFKYVTGNTSSGNFPFYLYLLNRVPSGAAGDAFVLYLDASGRLANAVGLGGKGMDTGTGIALDHNGGVWIAGTTCSSDFPVVGPT
jgi:hypothetical protein